MTNHSKTLFTGVTNNLKRRVYEHKNKLVYFEETQDITSAIAREKQIKGWLRRKKIDLIESINPEWKDLSDGWF